jgi:AcrR family transcriptional regulator
MSPRRSQAEAQKTRERIIERAMDLASVEGLEGGTIGRLAADLGMSKAGVIGHFGSKEALQLATVDAAEEVFRSRILDPAMDEEPGLARLLAICDAWIDYAAGGTFEGGCFFEAAYAEMDGRKGPVRDRIADDYQRWNRFLEKETATAIDAGELSGDLDVDQVTFELRAIISALNQNVQLRGDTRSPERARRGMRRVLGLPPEPAAAKRNRPRRSGSKRARSKSSRPARATA